ncbi:MAG: DUF4349 domain-containing protein [Algicola sp.]|nr:DUF4349 domain-containing protein [Algicola sp.]
MNAILEKRRFKMLILGMVFMGIISCQQNHKEDISMNSADITEEYKAVSNKNQETFSSIDASTNEIPQNLKIIKSANVRYKVLDVNKSTRDIKQMASHYNAYISDLRFENDLHHKENRFTIKIPNQYFDSLMDSINKDAEFIEFENITTKDVTEEYVDIETRLKTKLEVKSRYESILRKNAKTVEDILATEDKLRIIQEEIESAQGRLKYLTNKVSFSTIQIDLYEMVVFKEEPRAYNKTLWSKSKEGLVFGWNFLENIFVAVLHVWPLLILSGILAFWFRGKIKPKKAKN